MKNEQHCKICGGGDIEIFAHTAHCRDCRVLLYYPYPKNDDRLVSDGEGKKWPVKEMLDWYSEAAFLNHTNFTDMLSFATDCSPCITTCTSPRSPTSRSVMAHSDHPG